MEGGNQYLIPANSKRSLLIFGVFRPIDLIIFSVGIVLTILLLLILPIESLPVALCAVIPGILAAFLVLPMPNYHNILQLIKILLNFAFERQQFIWKGWDYKNEYKEETTKGK